MTLVSFDDWHRPFIEAVVVALDEEGKPKWTGQKAPLGFVTEFLVDTGVTRMSFIHGFLSVLANVNGMELLGRAFLRR